MNKLTWVGLLAFIIEYVSLYIRNMIAMQNGDQFLVCKTKFKFLFIKDVTELTMFQSVTILEYRLYHKKCELLLKQPEIRFAGFLDSMGNLIAGGFKQGIIPLDDESERRKLHIETVLRGKIEQEFNYDLGSVAYSATRRNKVVTFTFPVDEKVLFVSSQLSVNIDKTAKKIIKICGI